MKMRILILSILLTTLALPAAAVIKVYNSTPPNGTPGDVSQFTTTLCPPIDASPGTSFGNQTLDDSGGGSVTMVDYLTNALTIANLGPAALDSVFGPGSFVFVNGDTSSLNQDVPHVGTGSTAPSGSVTWGVLTGWVNTGTVFCVASPQTICTASTMVPHGITVPVAAPDSPTYDLGTWSFDAAGDLQATGYITGTSMGGTSNRQTLIRGAFVGSAIPALPLIGAGALAIGLAVAGTRSLLRKK